MNKIIKKLKKPVIAYVAIAVVALVTIIGSLISWSNSGFHVTSFVMFLIELILLALVALGIKKQSASLSAVSGTAYIAYVIFNMFEASGSTLKMYIDMGNPAAKDVTRLVFMILFSLMVIVSFALFVVRMFIGKKDMITLINAIACAAGVVFGLVAFIMTCTLQGSGAGHAAMIINALNYMFIPATVLIVSANMAYEK